LAKSPKTDQLCMPSGSALPDRNNGARWPCDVSRCHSQRHRSFWNGNSKNEPSTFRYRLWGVASSRALAH